jgi:chemotaxis protein histidine kinase CheA
MKRTTATRPALWFCALLLAGFSLAFPPVAAAAQPGAIDEDTIRRAEAAVQAQIQAEEKALAEKKAIEEKALAAREAAREKARAQAEAKAAAQKRAAEKVQAAKRAAEEKRREARARVQEKARARAEAKAAAQRRAAEKAQAVKRAAEEKALAETKRIEERAQVAVQEKLARTEAIVAEKVPAAWLPPKAGKPADFVRPEREVEAEIRHLAWLCNETLRNRDLYGARETLASLERLLPEKSLTLLRLRAWYAMSIGEDGRARELYREILRRLDDDANSAINLAVLEARGGRAEEARKIILDISGRLPDSERLQSARRAFGLSP